MDEFEKTLAGIPRIPMEPGWRDEMIENALNRRIGLLTLLTRFALTGVALCWLAAGALYLATPKMEKSSQAQLAEERESISIYPVFALSGDWRARWNELSADL